MFLRVLHHLKQVFEIQHTVVQSKTISSFKERLTTNKCMTYINWLHLGRPTGPSAHSGLSSGTYTVLESSLYQY